MQQIYLVTHAWHMPRAQLAFEHAGFSVIPAPTGYTTRFELTVLDFLPDADALCRQQPVLSTKSIGIALVSSAHCSDWILAIEKALRT